MERVIRERGEPLTRGQIVEALEMRDVVIPAVDKSRYIGTLAWRHKSIFVNIDGRGYWLRAEGVPSLSGAPVDSPEYRKIPEEKLDTDLF